LPALLGLRLRFTRLGRVRGGLLASQGGAIGVTALRRDHSARAQSQFYFRHQSQAFGNILGSGKPPQTPAKDQPAHQWQPQKVPAARVRIRPTPYPIENAKAGPSAWQRPLRVHHHWRTTGKVLDRRGSGAPAHHARCVSEGAARKRRHSDGSAHIRPFGKVVPIHCIGYATELVRTMVQSRAGVVPFRRLPIQRGLNALRPLGSRSGGRGRYDRMGRKARLGTGPKL